MHGLIGVGVEKFVTATLGRETWKRVLDQAGMGSRVFVPIVETADEDVVELLTLAAKAADENLQAMFKQFGQFVVPDLIREHRALINDAWRTLDLIENTEEAIHTVIRLRDPGAAPPQLRCTRESANVVVVRYSSPRKMCSVAKGIVSGVARHYQESVAVTEKSCMHRGDTECTITVTQTRR